MKCNKSKLHVNALACPNVSSFLVGIVNDPKTFYLFFISLPLQYSLHVAAGQGDLNAVKSHVERGADINMKDDNGVSIREISRR